MLQSVVWNRVIVFQFVPSGRKRCAETGHPFFKGKAGAIPGAGTALLKQLKRVSQILKFA
jgi:hypothetical protein